MKPVLRIAAFTLSRFPGAAGRAAAGPTPAIEGLLRVCHIDESGAARDPTAEQLMAIGPHLARARGRN